MKWKCHSSLTSSNLQYFLTSGLVVVNWNGRGFILKSINVRIFSFICHQISIYLKVVMILLEYCIWVPLLAHHAHFVLMLHLAPSHLSVTWFLPFCFQIIEQLELSFPLRWVPPSFLLPQCPLPCPHLHYSSSICSTPSFMKLRLWPN